MRVKDIKEKIMDNVYDFGELSEIMENLGYKAEHNSVQDGCIKFTNGKSSVWIEGETDSEDGIILVTNVKNVTRTKSDPTRVDRFHSFEDLQLVQNYFLETKKYEYWLAGWLCVSLGRRVGDILALKWGDIYFSNMIFRKKLAITEEKTEKVVGGLINELAKSKIVEYMEITGVNPELENKIFSRGYESFRMALKKAVEKVGLDYPVGTHSYRKFYANTQYVLHPQDDDRLTVIQTEMGHSDSETTKLYIGAIDDKIALYNEDYSNYILDKQKGIDREINNSPIISLKSDDYRKILSKLYDAAFCGGDKFEIINSIIAETEKIML